MEQEVNRGLGPVGSGLWVVTKGTKRLKCVSSNERLGSDEEIA